MKPIFLSNHNFHQSPTVGGGGGDKGGGGEGVGGGGGDGRRERGGAGEEEENRFIQSSMRGANQPTHPDPKVIILFPPSLQIY